MAPPDEIRAWLVPLSAASLPGVDVALLDRATRRTARD
jgi:hypothetical protein